MCAYQTWLKNGLGVAALTGALAAASSASAQTAPTNVTTDDEHQIIVTGTRKTGMTVAESAAPISVLGTDALGKVGQPNVNQVLNQLVPSFTAETFGRGAANLTLSAALRGLNPNHTLILVNGKRRHGSASIHVLSGPFQGGAAPDLDFIPLASIERVEVLQDGASAQYGSDAIAGVINIILKRGSGGQFSVTAGQNYAGDGKTASPSVNYGIKGDRGFLDVSAFYRHHDHTARGGADSRVANQDGTLKSGFSAALGAAYSAMPGFPDINPVKGDASSDVVVGSYNTEYELTDNIRLYSFGSIAHRTANNFQNTRLPDRVVRSGTPGVAGTFDQAIASGHPEYIFSMTGFIPSIGLKQLDYQSAIGIKGDLAGWNWDLSTTYGRDKSRLYSDNSVNRAEWIDQIYKTSETKDFYNGAFIASEWTSNLDITRKLGVFNLASGVEYRRNFYSIETGEPSSYYKTGPEATAGYSPINAGAYHRDNVAVYGDVAFTPNKKITVDAAGRFEHYSDFGNKATWKVTGRYDFTPAIAIRGTIATGFSAPNLALEHYSGTNTSTVSSYVQIPADSPAAKALGVQPLKPETSRSYSAGFVVRPTSRVTITLDAYQIDVRNRILGTGNIRGFANSNKPANFANGTVINPNVLAALLSQAGGAQNIDFSLPEQGILLFTNAGTTRSRGLDLITTFNTSLFGGHANFSIAANYNKNTILKLNPIPPSIANFGQTLFDKAALSYITTATPRYKVVGSATWTSGRFSTTLRESLYGKTSEYLTDNSVEYVKNTVRMAFITDLELSYNLTRSLTLTFGANNLFNKEPQAIRFNSRGVLSDGNTVYGAPLGFAPYGTNGGYYYTRINFQF